MLRSVKIHVIELQLLCPLVSPTPDSKTVLSGRAVKDVLSVFVLRIFVQDERKMSIFQK